MEEIWKDVEGYEGLYQISNLARVRRIGKRNSFKKPTVNSQGYLEISLWRENKCKVKLLHRILAEAFIPNPENKEQVNHIDGNKSNCIIENLEWVTRKENAQHAWRTGLCVYTEAKREGARRAGKKRIGRPAHNRKKVYCYETDKIYNSAKEAAEDTKTSHMSVSEVCRGLVKQGHTKGFHFEYIEG